MSITVGGYTFAIFKHTLLIDKGFFNFKNTNNMTRNVYYSETNDSSLVLNKLDNGLFRVQLDKNTVDLTKVDLAREIEDLKK